MRLRHIAAVNPATPEFDLIADDQEVPFLPLDAVWPGGRLDVTRRRRKSQVAVGYTRLREEDILVPKITPTFQADRTVIARNLEGGVAAATTEVHLVRVSSPSARRYVRYLLSSGAFLSFGEASMIGVAGQKRVPESSLKDLRIPVGAFEEHRRISDFLDRETAYLDALIAKKHRMVALLNNRRDAYRWRRTVQHVNPLSGTGQLPAGWRLCALGVLIQLHRGFDLPAHERREGPIPVVTSGGAMASHDTAACDGPGVVTGRYGTIGSVYWVDGPYWPLNTTLFVSDFRGHDPRWVFHLLASMPLNIDEEKSAVTGINRNVVGKLRVAVPPLEKQRSIAATIDRELERTTPLISKLRQQLRLLEERRRSLISHAVTGELPVLA